VTVATEAKQEAKAKGNGQQPPEPFVVPRNAAVLSEIKRNVWEVEVAAGTKVEQLLEPEAWGPLSGDFGPKDLLYVQPKDGAWLAVCRVRNAWPGGVQVLILQTISLPAIADGSERDRIPPGYSIKRDESLGWTITRLKDNVLMANQKNRPELVTREDCVRYLLDHADLRAPRA
jgi:hypothetical protein